MATFDKLEKNLERLFTKKKKAAAFRESLLGSNRPSSPTRLSQDGDSIQQRFPSPSFIRPKSSRMLARDEPVLITRSTRRANSLPEASDLSKQDCASQDCSRPKEVFSLFPKVPRRSSSLLLRNGQEAGIPALFDFTFAEKADRLANRSSASSSRISPVDRPVQRRKLHNMNQTSTAVFASHRPDTPPLSDNEMSVASNSDKDLPRLPLYSGPTPDPSPTTTTFSQHVLNRNYCDEASLASSSERPNTAKNPTANRSTTKSLRKVLSDSTLSITPAPTREPILKEPTLDEIFSLTDDEIADGCVDTLTRSSPPSCGLPPNPPVSGNSPSSNDYHVMTLSSPSASRIATMAAFEAARIAVRYKFDLIYVLNLLPANFDNTTTATPFQAPNEVVGGQGSHVTILPRSSGMTGRLLAAYGLKTLVSPVRISAPVHLKVLETPGWLEYRVDPVVPEELARGYSCSFYGNVCDDSLSQHPSSPASPSRKRRRSYPKSQGIVFAAYRRPLPDGTTLTSEPAELEALHQEAEALVEMIIDVHTTDMARNPAAGRCDGPGLMPARPQHIALVA